MADTAWVVFTPSGLRGEFPLGTSVLRAAQQLGVDLESVCGGRGECGRCQIEHAVGEFPKHAINSRRQHLSPPTAAERASSSGVLSQGRRLGCSARILGDLVVDVPAQSQLHKQHIAKQAGSCEMTHDPAVTLYPVVLPAAEIGEAAADLSRLQRQLQRVAGVDDPDCALAVMQQLQAALKEGKGAVSVAVYHPVGERPEIIAVWPGTERRLYGLAIDLGSTTLAVHLCDLVTGEVQATAVAMNPQIRFGEDLMSRVSYVMMHQQGAAEMTRAVRQVLSGMAAEVAGQAGISVQEILDLTLVCNPIMHHLLLGIDPTPLGSAPFSLAVGRAITLRAAELDIALHPQARAYLLPCISGHVGADTAGMLLAERPDRSDQMTLLVDVGTNAEIVLGNRQRLLAASSPTGPAFEGAQISCGQRAAPGAIERVRIDRQTLEPRFKVIGCELWSDQDGFAEQTADVGVTGICGSGIIELVAELFLSAVISAQGVIDPAMAATTPRVVADGRTFSYLLHRGERELRITQNDVRAIQLAKAALYAGIRLLMDHAGVDQVQRIALAGAFGSHIDVQYAMVLGLIPDCDLAQVSSVGNAAGTGARIALLDRGKRAEIEQLVRRVEKVETALEPGFQAHFVDAMALPHRRDPFTQLGRVVQLPEQRSPVDPGQPRGRRKRRAHRQ